MKEFVIDSIDKLVSVVEECHAHLNNNNVQLPLWWRGHAELTWQLKPRLYRDGLAESEKDMTKRFMREAAIRHGKAPDYNDIGSWLFLMQHYRLPTRLLDWSNSPLIAAYFVVSNTRLSDKDGVIWGLAPHALNTQGGDDTGEILNHPIIRVPSGGMFPMAGSNSPCWPDFHSAFTGQKSDKTERVLAVKSNHFDVRQMVQHSTFTIHGLDEKMDKSANNDKYLVKLTIPADAKKYFRTSLEHPA